jgi:hypothetical protein
MKQKTVTRTYRNGKAVFQMDFIVRLGKNLVGSEFYVTEQRSQYKDEKIIFVGRGKTAEKDADKFYTDTVTCTVLGGSSPLVR